MKGSILKREGKRGVSWLLKYDLGRDPKTNKRRIGYATVRGTRKQAEAELVRLLNAAREGLHVDRSKVTVGEWVERWLADNVEHAVSARTFERYGELLRHYVVPHIGGVKLQQLKAGQINAMYAELRKSGRRQRREGSTSGLHERTLLHVHRVLFSCISAAAAQSLIALNPFQGKGVVAPKPGKAAVMVDEAGEEGASIQALDRAQLTALLIGFKQHELFPIVATAAATGLRRGELLALRWSDIDFEGHALTVARAIEKTKANGIRVKLPKNKASIRKIGIDAGTVALLRREQLKQKELALKLGRRLPSDGLVFPGLIERGRGNVDRSRYESDEIDFKRPLDPDFVTRSFMKRAARCGFDIRFHDMRHTHATLLLAERVPVHAVAQRLGHSTPTITMSVYAHVLRRAEEDSAQVAGGFVADALKDATEGV